jgi:hypothetical protein
LTFVVEHSEDRHGNGIHALIVIFTPRAGSLRTKRAKALHHKGHEGHKGKAKKTRHRFSLISSLFLRVLRGEAFALDCDLARHSP